ncbi:MarR family protein [Geodermatophilus telluris]|uniref:MarR family protein n=1 Tax=Geodermatophilus telluris TaxID=1190417 RepID=A0A1G6NVB5_9ACTN|nr:winged helix-turn-helix domain-containing protein [Geodermatophilus telluris]SDC71591.1 MarR family protein [Geodermatophilus telluris]
MTASTTAWTFLSNHGHVLVSLAMDPEVRVRDVATRVGITERSVQMIVADLERAGYVVREQAGRHDRYVVVHDRHFRHPLEEHVRVGDFLDLVRAGRGHPAGPDGTRSRHD